MNRKALEAQLKALMDEASPKTPEAPSYPKAHPSKTLIAALIVGGTILGALLMGIFHSGPVPPLPASNIKETAAAPGKQSEGDSVLFYIGLGRIRK